MAPARKPLFTKPAWATKSNPSQTDSEQNTGSSGFDNNKDAPIFSNKHVYEDIVAEERRRREKHAQRVKEREKRTSAKQNLNGSNESTRSAKRRRVSLEEDDEDEIDQGSEGSGTDISKEKTSPLPRDLSAKDTDQGLANGPDVSDQSKSTRKNRTNATPTILLDDEEENATAGGDGGGDAVKADESSSRFPMTKEPILEPESEEEDEFLQELKRKAREEARLKKLGISNSNKETAAGSARPAADSLEANFLTSPGLDNDQSRIRAASTPMPDDPEVEILIETIIPNAKQVIVKRHASQPLDKVKDYWCRHNELNPVIASKVFLTWNGMRLYQSSTTRGILEALKKARPMKDGSDPSRGKICLEAVTDEIFEYRLQQQQRRQKEAEEEQTYGDRMEAKNDDDLAGTAHDDGNEDSSNKKLGPVIKLHCPGIEEMMIRLRPNTTVRKIIAAFRAMREIDPGKQCWLSYDGEKLEPDLTAEAVGFEHEDSVDVYLR